MEKLSLSNTNYKKAFSLFELIVVLFVSSIVIIYTFIFTKELYETQDNNQHITMLKIDLNSTKILMKKNLSTIDTSIKYDGSTLFLKGNILLKDVTTFTIKRRSNNVEINITLEDKISQSWKFSL